MSAAKPGNPLISICIPAYKNTAHLKRLLDSIAAQTFTDFEVIVTDDSPDDSVHNLVDTYQLSAPIHYYKNQPAAGTPENWNIAIRKARGTWIKLMHNDDWFVGEKALAKFYESAQHHPGCHFFFSAFQNITEGTVQTQVVRCKFFDLLFLKISPLHLFKRVYVGNPSCTFIHRDVELLYDRQFKFVVDFEYYIRCMRKLKQWQYVDDVLLNIGFHAEQVTKYTFLNPAVQLPENYRMLEKLGYGILRNVFVYDYYWRMHRNLGIRSMENVKVHYDGVIPPPMQSLIRFQAKLPVAVLRNGLCSKALMLLHYFKYCLKAVWVK
jgi:glycosyltransferase involved in cell wall biosynthesis